MEKGDTFRERTCLLLLALFAALVCFGDLIFYSLESGDGTRVAGISAEMALTGDWIVPRLNGVLFLEYPPLFYQFQALCFRIFGITHFATHLPSAIASFCGVFFLYVFLRYLTGDRLKALSASLMLLVNVQFLAAGRRGIVDMLLVFFVLIAVCGFYWNVKVSGKMGKTMSFLLFAAGLSGGVMTKGPVGLAIPLSGIGIWLILDDILERKFRFKRYAITAFGVLIALIPPAVWSYLLYRAEGGEALHTVFVANSVGRFASGKADHASPWYFYLLRVPALFQPWLLLTFGGVIVMLRNREQLKKHLFWLCALTVPFILLSAASGKRQLYLLPLLTPAAVLASIFFTEHLLPYFRKLQIPEGKAVLFGRIALAVLVIAVLPSGIFAFPVLGMKAFIFPVLVLAVLPLVFFRKSKTAGYILSGAFLLLSLTMTVCCRKTIRYSVAPMFETCRTLEQQGYKILLAGSGERTRGAAVFYLHKTVPVVSGPEKSPDGKTVWIIRGSCEQFTGKIIPFNDHHKIIIQVKNPPPCP